MNKKVSIGTKPMRVDANAWVESRGNTDPEALQAVEPVKEEMKRLTIDIPASLHKQIKSTCALRGTKIADELRELLIQKYGNQ